MLTERGEFHAGHRFVLKHRESGARLSVIFKFRDTSVQNYKKSRMGVCASFPKERILFEQKSLHEVLEQKAAAQTRVSEAQAELEEETGKGEMLILLFMKLADSSNPRGWNSVRQINCPIRLEGKGAGYVKN